MAAGISDRSATRRSRSAGCWPSQATMQDSEAVTVSRPANISRNRMFSRSSSEIGSPPTSDRNSTAMTSLFCSVSARRLARKVTKYSSSLPPATAIFASISSNVSPSGWITPCLKSKKKSRSSTGAPTRRKKVSDGNGTQNSSENSASPREANVSMSSPASSRICASSGAICLGPKIGSSSLRHFLWSSPSISSGIKGLSLPKLPPWPPLPRIAGWRLILMMSSWR